EHRFGRARLERIAGQGVGGAAHIELEHAGPDRGSELAVRGRDLEARGLCAGVRLELEALEPKRFVDREVGEPREVVPPIVRDRPDVSVVDVRMPPTQRDEGLRAAIEARRRVPGTPILVLSQYVERQYATELLADRAGGVGYLLKDRVGDIREFMDGLRRVAKGG